MRLLLSIGREGSWNGWIELVAGVERDEKVHLSSLDQAAIGGHLIARHNLGAWEEQKGSMERAANHFLIAANLGFDLLPTSAERFIYKGSCKQRGLCCSAIRAHQVEVGATESPQRDAAEVAER